MEEIPTLEQLCYELLAEYAGYIEDLGTIRDDSILAICQKTDAFGLLNLEYLMTSHALDTREIWKGLYQQMQEQSPGYFPDSVGLLRGNQFYRQAMLTAFLTHQLEHPTLDEEDMDRLLLTISSSLKLLEIHTATPVVAPAKLLQSLPQLMYIDFSRSKLGPELGPILRDYLASAAFVHELKLRNVNLQDAGALALAEGLDASRSLNSLDLAFNRLTLVGVRRLAQTISGNPLLVKVDISRNLFGQDIKQGYLINKQIQQQRPGIIFAIV